MTLLAQLRRTACSLKDQFYVNEPGAEVYIHIST